jgi:hypothetical protein
MREHLSLTPEFGRQRQADLCEFKANLVYIVPGQQGYIVRCCLESKKKKEKRREGKKQRKKGKEKTRRERKGKEKKERKDQIRQERK